MDDIEVIKGDALTEMAKFPDGSFAAIVTDPAYWTLDIYRAMGTTTRLGGGKSGDSDPDKFFPTIDHDYLIKCIMEFDRLLPKNGHAWIMCDHLTQVYILGFVREAGRRAQGGTDFIYSKLYPVLKRTADGQSYKPGMGYHGRAVTEYAILLEKGRRKFSDTNWPDVFAYPWVGATESSKFTPDGKPYPTAKPQALYERLIRLSTSEGERVLDPFAGSGACGAAARLSGRRATLIDQSARSIKTIMKRLHPPTAFNPSMFDYTEETPMTTPQTKQIEFDNEAIQEMVTIATEGIAGRPPIELHVPCFDGDHGNEAYQYAKRTGGELYTWKAEGIHNWLVTGCADLVDFFCFVVLPEHCGDYISLLDDEDTEIDTDDEDTLPRPATLTVPLSFRLYLPPSSDISESGYVDHTGLVALLRKYKGQPEAIQYIADMME